MNGGTVRAASVDAKLEAVIRRDRAVVITALLAVIALAWAYLLAGERMDMPASGMARAVRTSGYPVLMFFMWCVMMVAMMLPSAAPMILLVATINRGQRDSGHPHVATSIFVFGYLVVWAGFSLLASTVQWGFELTGILSSMHGSTDAIFGGLLLLAAGAYQLTPIKHACLRRCRSPLGFIGTHWRPGARGALRMGLLHGAFCVGCCGFLMGLMWFGGVMNLYWVAGLAVLVLLEKTLPAGHWLGYATGVILLVGGGGMLAGAL